MKKRLYRSKTDKKLCGVCAGVADYFGIDPSIVRVICLVVVTEEIRFLMSRRLAMGLSSPLIQKHPNGAWP